MVQVLVMHHPPFLQTETEPHAYFNMPLVPRARMMALVRKYGVRTLLTGHTHTTRSWETSDGIKLVTTAGTSVAFDHNGCGYQQLTMNASSLAIDYIQLPNHGGAPGCVKTQSLAAAPSPINEYLQ